MALKVTPEATPGVVTVAIRIAYDGAAFDSYARQPGRRTAEGALLEALARDGLVEGSFRTGSRTDAGVSAWANVVRADLTRPHLRGLVPALQRNLPDGLWCTGAAAAPEGFDPRKAAWRQYSYLAPAEGEREEPMRKAAKSFVGTHEMSAFARIEAGRNPERTVLACEVARKADLWEFRVKGESFLWGQVRRMVGAVLAVGKGEAEPEDVARSLQSGRPHPRFMVAPAEGLTLEHVEYPGLQWDEEAGGIDLRKVRPLLVQAQVRQELAKQLAALTASSADPQG